MAKVHTKRIFEKRETIAITIEPTSVQDFIRELMALETKIIKAGFPEVTVENETVGEYSDAQDFLVLVGRREETDAEFNARTETTRIRSESAKKRHEQQLAVAKSFGYTTVQQYNTFLNSVKCPTVNGKYKCGGMIDIRQKLGSGGAHCEKCGRVIYASERATLNLWTPKELEARRAAGENVEGVSNADK